MGVLVAVLTNSVGQQPVALVVADDGPSSVRMALRILEGDSDTYLLARMAPQEAGTRALGHEQVAAIVVIPRNFDARLREARAEVDLYLNNVDIDLADDIRRSVTRSVTEIDAPQLGLLGELHGPSDGIVLPNAYRVAIAEHELSTTNVSFLQYQVIPILVLIVLSVGLMGTALLTARDFERGTAKVLLLSPARPLSLDPRARFSAGRRRSWSRSCRWSRSASRRTEYPTARMRALHRPGSSSHSDGPCTLGCCRSPSRLHAVALAALLLALIVMAVGVGILVGVALREARIVTMASINLATCLFFLGGGFTTVAFLPRWIQLASRLVPTSYAIEALRQVLFYPDLPGVAWNILIVAAFALVATGSGAFFLTRAWKRP